MANSLLDFVMGLVRDPEAAARYDADPAQAIADAHLTDVSSVDVDNLIPVVSESLSSAMPGGGFDSAVDSNVWSSGAATEAFDAFAAPTIDQPAGDAMAIVTDTVPDSFTGITDTIAVPDDAAVASALPEDLSVQLPEPQAVDFAVDGVVDAAHQSGVFEPGVIESHIPTGFDIFE